MDKKDEAKPKENTVQCPLCGHKFSCDEAESCEGCPLRGKTCKVVQCPNCSYEIPIIK